MNDDLSNAKQRKINSQVGAILLGCGLLALIFGLFATFIAGLQSLVLQIIPAPTTAHERDVMQMMWRMISLFLLFMPTMAMLGGLLLASGWQVTRGNATAIRVARWILLGAIGFGVVYLANIAAMLFDLQMAERMLDLPAPLAPYRPVIYTVQGVFAVGMQFGPPVLLLLLLRRVRPIVDDKSALTTSGK